MSESCCISGCGQSVVATLDIRALCRTHFISACYDQIDEYCRWLEDNRHRDTSLEMIRRFLSECTQQATELSQKTPSLDNLERARLLDILLRAGDLSRHLRRSPRKEAAIPVRLACDKLGRAWEEETHTRVLSRYGAAIECQHPAEIGDPLVLVRLDTGMQVRARVAWRQPRPGGYVELGIEFQQCDNFWDLDWNSAEPPIWQQDLVSKQNRS